MHVIELKIFDSTSILSPWKMFFYEPEVRENGPKIANKDLEGESYIDLH